MDICRENSKVIIFIHIFLYIQGAERVQEGRRKGKLTAFYFLFGPGNLSVEAEVDLLSYCAREWKGETPRTKLMRKVCLFLEGMGEIEFVCQNQETNIPFCFTKSRDPSVRNVNQVTTVALTEKPNGC